MLIFPTVRQKLDKKAMKLHFVGYCRNSKGYRLYDECTRKIVRSRDMIFNEADFVVKTPAADESETDVEPQSVKIS
jgi:hypothetical protein